MYKIQVEYGVYQYNNEYKNLDELNKEFCRMMGDFSFSRQEFHILITYPDGYHIDIFGTK